MTIPRRLFATAVFTGLAVLLAALPVAAQTGHPAPLCLYAFSKDLCSAGLFDGVWGLPVCATGGGTGCNNLVGNDATFRGPLTNSSGLCGDPLVPCDEAPDFIGQLVAMVDVRTQRHTPCKARGSWEGPFRLLDSTGAVFAGGDLVATLGMGTHRQACHSTTCSKDCETCHDARIISHTADWQIGSEGTLKGSVIAGRYAGCTFTASFQGDFTANGDTRGPLAPADVWKYCGTIEGVLECPCPP
ncbi:MAG TPA: hypothetical protein VF756_25530 [Thermoanaerobaculia bacterium]